jgi:hypothetical protein
MKLLNVTNPTGNPGYVGRKRWAKPFDRFRFRTLPLVIPTEGTCGFLSLI